MRVQFWIIFAMLLLDIGAALWLFFPQALVPWAVIASMYCHTWSDWLEKKWYHDD